jgi:hypothetical protein
MPASNPLFQEVYRQIDRIGVTAGVRKTSAVRLALFVTGVIAAKSCVLQQIATDLVSVGVTRATEAESIVRRLGRTLCDPLLDPARGYAPLLPQVIAWQHHRPGTRVFLILDESSKKNRLHLVRMSLAYQGSSVPVAWRVWKQNVRLPDGEYWTQIDAMLAEVTALIPPGAAVIVLADRAYDIPAFVDRMNRQGWHWIVRCKDHSELRFRDVVGREQRLADLITRHVLGPGHRWKGRGQVFKGVGWRDASVVSIWTQGEIESLTVLSDRPPPWFVAHWYRRRFWTEPGFRNDKRRGWQWEQSQVQGISHSTRLLTVMGWATVLAVVLGAQEARRHLQQVPHRRIGKDGPGKPRHATASLFTMGVGHARRWLFKTSRRRIVWELPEITADTWDRQWWSALAHRFLTKTVRS